MKYFGAALGLPRSRVDVMQTLGIPNLSDEIIERGTWEVEGPVREVSWGIGMVVSLQLIGWSRR